MLFLLCNVPLLCCPTLEPANYGLKPLQIVNQNKDLLLVTAGVEDCVSLIRKELRQMGRLRTPFQRPPPCGCGAQTTSRISWNKRDFTALYPCSVILLCSRKCKFKPSRLALVKSLLLPFWKGMQAGDSSILGSLGLEPPSWQESDWTWDHDWAPEPLVRSSLEITLIWIKTC